MNDRFYDVVDSEGNVVETAEQQRAEATLDQVIEEQDVAKKLSEAVQDTPQIDLTPAGIKAAIKKWNRENVTCKLPRVIGANGCGHRLDLGHQPRHRSCDQCWFAWFNAHGELVQQLDEMHNNGNDRLIVELQGVKFMHRWRQFMATIAQWKLQQETNEQTSSISIGVDAGRNTGDTTGVQITTENAAN